MQKGELHKVLIVDDDRLIRNDLKNLFDWRAHRMDPAFEADNGVQALALLAAEDVHIVVTDIHMPVMDGVDLIRWAKSYYPGLEFVVISNYDDFRYVKEAMKAGASDYVLKYEMDEHSFPLVMDAARDTYEKKQNETGRTDLFHETILSMEERAGHFWRRLLLDPDDHDFLPGEADDVDAGIDSAPCIMLMLEIDCRNFDVSDTKKVFRKIDKALRGHVDELTDAFRYHFTLRVDEGKWIVILRTAERSRSVIKNTCFALARSLLQRIRDQFRADLVIEIGDVISGIRHFPDMYHRMMDCMDSRFYLGPVSVIDISYAIHMESVLDTHMLDLTKQMIVESIECDDFQNALKEIRYLFGKIEACRPLPSLVYEYVTVLAISIRKALEERGITVDSGREAPIEQKVRQFCTIGALAEWFEALLTEASTDACNPQGIPYRKEIRKVITLIRREYMKPIPLEVAARHVGFSRNYLCRIFKEETGENYIDYLQHFRIEKAKRLIAGTDRSMKEIAAMVGLDYSYFCKVFHDLSGGRPSDWR